ncbi:unnamed protein product [Scytosiphon promiscuus]
MHSWCALAPATALLLASEGVAAFPGTRLFSSGNIKRIMADRRQLQQAQGGRLWARRRINQTARLHLAETGVPDVAAPCDRSLEPAGNDADSPGSSLPPHTGGNKLTERGGLLLLATVPLVWGTYSPSVKYLYQMGESPPGLLFNFACYAVSVLTFAAVAGLNSARTRRTASAAGGAGSEVEAEESLPQEEKTVLDRYATRAGAELGLWLFLGGTVQVWGLELTSASRAGFLVQLTTVFVPVLEAFLGRRKLKPQVWFACALATVGVAMVSLGGILPPGADVVKYVTGLFSAARLAPAGGWERIASGNLRGDLLVACSALFYSLHVVRLGVHVSKVDTLSLARAKALSELGFSGLSVLIAGSIGGQGGNFARFISALASKPELWLVFGAVTVWNGALTSAYAMWAQTRGQASVAPSEANLVYSLQPLWSVFFAALILKESFRGVEAAGAALLLLSLVLVAAQTGGGDPASSEEDREARASAKKGDRKDEGSGKVA